MITQIVKRDGRVISYNEEKIASAIFKAAMVAAKKEGKVAEPTTAKLLAALVTAKLEETFVDNAPTVEEIQDTVVKTLIEQNHVKTSIEYILYREERNKKRNENSSIIRSIRKITDFDTVEEDSKRENANIDGNTAMGMMLQYGSTISKEYCKQYILKPLYAVAHDNGDIHIHDMDFMNMGTLTCCQIDCLKLFENGFSTGHGFIRTPNDILTYTALAAIVIQADQNDQHGGQSIPMFDYAMAGGVKKTFAKLYRENAVKVLKFYDINLSAKEYLKGETPSLTNHEEFDKKEFEFLNSLKVVPNVKHFQELIYNQTKEDTVRRTYQAMEAFIHNLNTMHSRAGAQVPFSSINFGTDTSVEGRIVTEQLLRALDAGLGNGETPIFPILIFKVKEGVNYNPGDPNYDLLRLSCKVSSKRLFPNFSFIDAPYNLQYYKEGHPETECAYMGCRTRVIGNVCGPEIVTGRGNCSFTSINLPSLGIKHGVVSNPKADLDGFFKELDEKLDLVIGQLLQRFDLQGKKKVKNFPFLMGQGVWLGSDNLSPNDTLEEVIKQGTLTVGFIGLAECLKALIGEHHGESEDAQKLGLEIIGHMRRRMDEASEKYKLNFSVIATPAEGLSGRFVKIDKKRYGIIPGVTDRDYYTNSFHVPVYFPISAFKKLAIEGKYHALTNAGHISYVELDGDPQNNVDAFEAIVRCMHDTGVGYGSINHPVDRDPVCGYTGIINGHDCPKCGRNEEESEIKFERIRRITGYLVGTLDRFNNAKKAEERDRVKHSLNID